MKTGYKNAIVLKITKGTEDHVMPSVRKTEDLKRQNIEFKKSTGEQLKGHK